MNLSTYAVKDIKHLKVLGRTTKNLEPLTLFWTASGIECNVKASELWVEVEADYEVYEPWISIVINGAYISRLMIPKGRQWICVFRGMNGDKVKNVKLLKEVQAMSGDNAHCLQIHNFKCDGQFLPVEDRPYKIEFIGDSITSGEGSIGAREEEEWISMWFSTENNYARMSAELLNADYRIIAQSGWGVYTSWDNNPYNVLPLYYKKVCGLLKGEKNKELGALEDNDFEDWKPDVVVINLGTNDGGAFNSPEWRDEQTGETHKQRLNEDGSLNKEDVNDFEEAVIAFLYKLRRYNRTSYLLWVYGMIGDTMLEAINRAVDAYKMASGDIKVSVLELPNTTEETVGARCHPGALAHEIASKVLVKKIKEILA